jgi:pimeloyl-ACP methyl ester carboxylesterase
MTINKAPLSFSQWKQCGKYFEWRDHNVYFQRGGKGQVLLMLHGFPTCGWDWCWAAKLLVERFHMVVPDLLDYGQSLNAKQKPCSIMDQADMIEDLMRHRDIKEVHILAHDVGDTVAQELIARHNESALSFRILSSVFLNGGMIPDLHRPLRAQKLLAGPFGTLAARFVNKAKFLAGFANVFGKDTQPTGERLTEFWGAIKGVNGRPALARRIRYMAERRKNAERWVGALRDAYMPLMLINGLDDPVSGAHAADGWAKLVPKAKLVRLPGIGHYPQVEAPDTVAELVHQFHDCIVEKTAGQKSM